jgi:methionine synthase I (cobalamin-dependent)
MSRHHSPVSIEQINQRLAALSVQTRDDYLQKNPGSLVLVAGDLGPTGGFLYPAGELTLAEMTDIFREQVRGQLAAGVDLFMIETMMDLAEVRSAVLAVQSECDLPVLASLTFADNGRTLAAVRSGMPADLGRFRGRCLRNQLLLRSAKAWRADSAAA